MWALTCQPTRKIISSNLDEIQEAKEAFIANENSEKIKRKLLHNIRSLDDIKHVTRDAVYFKCMNKKKWHDPVRIPGQDGWQVLVKNSTKFKVHPYRLQLTPTQKLKQPIGAITKKILRSIKSQLTKHKSKTVNILPTLTRQRVKVKMIIFQTLKLHKHRTIQAVTVQN